MKTFKNFLAEDVQMQTAAKAAGLTHLAFDEYEDRFGNHFHWNRTTKQFDVMGQKYERNPDDIEPGTKIDAQVKRTDGDVFDYFMSKDESLGRVQGIYLGNSRLLSKNGKGIYKIRLGTANILKPPTDETKSKAETALRLLDIESKASAAKFKQFLEIEDRRKQEKKNTIENPPQFILDMVNEFGMTKAHSPEGSFYSAFTNDEMALTQQKVSEFVDRKKQEYDIKVIKNRRKIEFYDKQTGKLVFYIHIEITLNNKEGKMKNTLWLIRNLD